jgi:hypothetical protein
MHSHSDLLTDIGGPYTLQEDRLMQLQNRFWDRERTPHVASARSSRLLDAGYWLA